MAVPCLCCKMIANTTKPINVSLFCFRLKKKKSQQQNLFFQEKKKKSNHLYTCMYIYMYLLHFLFDYSKTACL